MSLSEWWVANPTDGTEDYQPPDRSERVPGALTEVGHGEYMLETIGFLDNQPFTISGSAPQSSPLRLKIWGTDRDGTCYSLFDSLRTKSALKMPHASAGHEDWSIGWLARGSAWVTPDSECSSVRIHIDDLPTWALYGQSDCFEFNAEDNTATIDLSDETLGATAIGGTHLSLIRSSQGSWNYPGQDGAQQVQVTSVAFWKVEGPLTLQTVINEWIEPFECLLRFMTMKPSVTTSINCHVGDWNHQPLEVELIAPRLQRDDRATSGVTAKPVTYLTTLRVLQEHSIDPMDVLTGYWNKVVMGDTHMALSLHLESQDRLVSRGVDGALLNAVRSVESLYAAQNPGVPVERVSVQAKIDDAISCARGIGAQLLNAWPELSKIGKLRSDVAHGKGRPAADFGIRCHGGAMALQWIQRVRLLTEFGIGRIVASAIVSNNYRYGQDLKTLKRWSAEL